MALSQWPCVLFILVFVFVVEPPSHDVNQNQGLVHSRQVLHPQCSLPHQEFLAYSQIHIILKNGYFILTSQSLENIHPVP